jgi:hypothetical protein
MADGTVATKEILHTIIVLFRTSAGTAYVTLLLPENVHEYAPSLLFESNPYP